MNNLARIPELIVPPEVELHALDSTSSHQFRFFDFIADGQYRVMDDGPLSRNVLADVYRTEDMADTLGSFAAVKVFREPTEYIRRRVSRELSAHIALNGLLGVVKTKDMGILSEGPVPQRYVATALADGTLAQFVKEQATNTSRIEAVLDMASQILPSVAAIHEMGLVHKDIKPKNILRYQSEEEWALTDFGLVGATPQKLGQLSTFKDIELWENETLVNIWGTVGYIAPELIADQNDFTPKADIFSMGVTIFNASTGKLPFGSDNIQTYVMAVNKDAPVDAQSLNRAIPAELSHLTMDCLEHDPNNRPTAAELVSAIESI